MTINSKTIVKLAAMAVAPTAYWAIGEFVLWPLHVAGYAQPVLRYVIGAGHLCMVPGHFLGRMFVAVTDHHYGPGNFVAAVVFNLVAWWFLVWVGYLVVRREKENKAKAGAEQYDGKADGVTDAVNRRVFIVRGLRGTAAAGIAGVAGWSFFVEPGRPKVERVRLELADLPPSLEGLRLLQLTDIHHGPWLSLRYVREVVARANALSPDFVVLTGDYVHQSPAYIRPVIAALAKLNPRIGVAAVLGNHDWWEDAALCRREFARHGIPMLDNARLIITPERRVEQRAEAGLCIAGVGDLWEDSVEIDRALDGVAPQMPRVLLSHNPDYAEHPQMTQRFFRVDAMLSGHTHGGQIWLPGFGTPVVPSSYGQKYAAGMVAGPACPVYISRGIGMAVLPLRFGVPPEITLFELQCMTESTHRV